MYLDPIIILTLLPVGPMEFPMKFDTVKFGLWMIHCIYEGLDGV